MKCGGLFHECGSRPKCQLVIPASVGHCCHECAESKGERHTEHCTERTRKVAELYEKKYGSKMPGAPK